MKKKQFQNKNILLPTFQKKKLPDIYHIDHYLIIHYDRKFLNGKSLLDINSCWPKTKVINIKQYMFSLNWRYWINSHNKKIHKRTIDLLIVCDDTIFILWIENNGCCSDRIFRSSKCNSSNRFFVMVLMSELRNSTIFDVWKWKV